jgi:16S rRNA (guanine527-N7)-methyltransferase
MNAADCALLAQGATALGITLNPEQLADFGRLADELVTWNRRINLTAITRPSEIVVKHFLDSLTLAPLLSGNESVLDVGSGAGFPALPLKIALPALQIVTVDAVQKKIHFQRHIIRLLGLAGIDPRHSRVEALAVTSANAFAVVTSRAFTGLTEFAQVALPLLAPAGRILAMKGREGTAEAVASSDQLARLGLRVTDVVDCCLPEAAGERVIITLRRIGD